MVRSRKYDCFISYTASGEWLARSVKRDLELHGLSAFVARASLEPGQRWSAEVLNALRSSDWVFFLAGKEARESAYVQQEVGGAIVGKKVLIPVIWDCSPEELPGWTKEFQALDLRNMTPQQMRAQILRIAARMQATKRQRATGALVFSSLVLAFLAGSDND